MPGFIKLFSEILDSTIWDEPDPVRIIWITMMAMTDRRGHVMASVPGLAHRARQALAATEKAIEALSSPDKHSRSKDYEGRRIEEIDGGWRLINYAKYREKRGADERRVYMAELMRKRRSVSRGVSKLADVSQESTDVSRRYPPLAQAEAEAEADKEKKKDSSERSLRIELGTAFNWLNLTQEQEKAWAEAYPAVNIGIEMKRAAEWIRANPTKRKKNLGGFLNRWFARTQEKGGSTGAAPRPLDKKKAVADYFGQQGKSGWTDEEAKIAWRTINAGGKKPESF